MAIYAISDLHLSFASPKPMDIFGPVWENHAEKIRENWDKIVSPSDTVLLPGDLSWALRLSEAEPDLQFIAERPGKKVLIRGNHDFWWQRHATNRMQREIGGNIYFLQGTSVAVDGVWVTGTRGWRVDCGLDTHAPQMDASHAERVLARELAYLEKGLQSIPASAERKIAMLHYPPFDDKLRPNEFARMLQKYSVDFLVYGHVHLGIGNWVEGDVEGVRYRMVSADVVDFKPQLILP